MKDLIEKFDSILKNVKEISTFLRGRAILALTFLIVVLLGSLTYINLYTNKIFELSTTPTPQMWGQLYAWTGITLIVIIFLLIILSAMLFNFPRLFESPAPVKVNATSIQLGKFKAIVKNDVDRRALSFVGYFLIHIEKDQTSLPKKMQKALKGYKTEKFFDDPQYHFKRFVNEKFLKIDDTTGKVSINEDFTAAFLCGRWFWEKAKAEGRPLFPEVDNSEFQEDVILHYCFLADKNYYREEVIFELIRPEKNTLRRLFMAQKVALLMGDGVSEAVVGQVDRCIRSYFDSSQNS